MLPAELSTVFNPESLRVHWSCLLAIISLLVYYGAGSVYNRLDGYYQVDWAAAESKHTVEFPHYDSVLKTLNRCLVQKWHCSYVVWFLQLRPSYIKHSCLQFKQLQTIKKQTRENTKRQTDGWVVWMSAKRFERWANDARSSSSRTKIPSVLLWPTGLSADKDQIKTRAVPTGEGIRRWTLYYFSLHLLQRPWGEDQMLV